ncbi:hypothetical protein [Streptacidiphilus melanogenes]|uniref:hypothetical protein n=1 Tax=Streptacidiphilus melanogenes TaxID=411235 RepID=UPI0005A5F765|nr:hypothetical protein [Streptacidiphilus melanogenes]
MRTSRIGLCVLASGAFALGALAPAAHAQTNVSVTVMKETNNGPVSGPLMPGDQADVVLSNCASGVTSGTATSKAFTATATLQASADRPTLQGFPTIANVPSGTYTVTASCGSFSATTTFVVASGTAPTTPATPLGPVKTGVGSTSQGINSTETGAGAALLALAGGGTLALRRKLRSGR